MLENLFFYVVFSVFAIRFKFPKASRVVPDKKINFHVFLGLYAIFTYYVNCFSKYLLPLLIEREILFFYSERIVQEINFLNPFQKEGKLKKASIYQFFIVPNISKPRRR